MSNKSKKKRSRINKKMVSKLGNILIYGASIYFLIASANIIFEMFSLKDSIVDTKKELTQIQGENDYLTAQRDKLKDPNYVQDYARGNYLLSKEGETIFYLPNDDNKPTE